MCDVSSVDYYYYHFIIITLIGVLLANRRGYWLVGLLICAYG